jgi:hypothetical protein
MKTKTKDAGNASPEPLATKGAGRPCSVCAHPNRAEIDAALVEGMLPIAISNKFDIGRQALVRHRDHHVPTPAMQQGLQAVAVEEAAMERPWRNGSPAYLKRLRAFCGRQGRKATRQWPFRRSEKPRASRWCWRR